MAYELETTVLGGLPVTVEYTVAPSEPDVGIFSSYVDDWCIVAINGRSVKKCDWLHRRIDATPGERDKLLEAMNEDAGEHDFDYPEY